jgi:integrase
MKARRGYVYFDKARKTWYARLTYTDGNGERRNVKQRAANKTQAEEALKKLVQTLDGGGVTAFAAEKLTLKDLCDFFKTHYCKPAEYVTGRKVGGLRSHVQVNGYLKVFRERLGHRALKSITYEDLRSFRAERLKSKTHQGDQRSIATVNREMAYLRRLLNIAERNSWIAKNPFKLGDPLINVADESKRERILSRVEETKLLAACTGRRAHLRPIVIAGLDTGCRMGELLKMKWGDISFDEGVITIRAFNTKTMRERQVSMTARLRSELESLRKGDVDEGALVFGIKREVRHGFKSACEEAGLKGVTFYALRHSAATRLVSLHVPLAEVGKVLGHTTPNTTYRYYLTADLETVRRAAAALDAFNAEVTAEEPQAEAESGMIN